MKLILYKRVCEVLSVRRSLVHFFFAGNAASLRPFVLDSLLSGEQREHFATYGRVSSYMQ